ncbi:RICIN domain-containing protein [[Clostridium] polysaccharolyticum]|uniref:Pectate lyase n=1 Tax=[Clostridium] polysaccharolyticum TaxID=29364 RepID=A0A1I0DEP9_9FIRM|nr:RICIN domain-containing protein [[Clostridium] polysaccharolyticum]SET30856.1 Pectate lyase [[Clostridium] polysaccharolyticum]
MRKRKLCALMTAAFMAVTIPSTSLPLAPLAERQTVVKAASKTVAFPGAEGGGKYATGGRGGEVYYVTNLNDSGAGSFRDAVSKSNRIVVFKVGGTIELKSDVVVRSNVTVAGQTAPGGGGITLKNNKIGLGGSNIILRYVSSRPGERGTNADYDAFGGADGANCIVDHCSIGWANDEQWGLYSNNDYNTVQWSIIGPSNSFSYHSKGIHGFGIMFGKSNCTMHHNMVVHNVSRNFRGKIPGKSTAEFVNNVIYDWGYQTAYGTIGHMNYVGNYLKMGKSTKGGYNYMCIDSTTNPENFGLYLKDNKMVTIGGLDYGSLTYNNWSGITYGSSNGRNESNVKSYSPYGIQINGENVAYAAKAESPQDAYDHVLSFAGAGINASSRPAIDQQVMYECKTGTGSCSGARPYWEANSEQKATIDKYSIACGVTYNYPAKITTGAPLDSDEDGMPDAWESARGLNPNSPYAGDGSLESSQDYCGKGYTNIEYYINDLTADSFPKGTVELSPAKAFATPAPSIKPSEAASVTPTNEVAIEAKEGIYQIQNVNSGLYLNVENGLGANNTNIQQWGSNSPADYDTFRLVSCNNGYFKIYSMLAGGTTYVLDIAARKTDNGTNIALYTDKNGANQQFKFVPQGDGTFAIMTRLTNDASCIDVENYSKDSGANVYQWVFNGTSNQLWRLVPVNTASPSPSIEPSVTPEPIVIVSPSIEPSIEADPSIEPSVEPEPSIAADPSIEPSVEPEPSIAASPSVETSKAPVPLVKVSVSGDTSATASCLNKVISITGTASETVDLSKLKVRYYYTADGSQNQTVWIDSAAMMYSVAPYYVNIAENVKGSIVKLTNPANSADSYLEVAFSGNYKVNNAVNGQVAFRIAKNDWSSFVQTNDYSFGDDKKVVVYYDGVVIAGVEP